MKRYRLVTALAFCATAGLIGQTGRDAYRQAYDVWQQAQANLERDAGTGGATQVAQADRSAAAESSFEATRMAYLKSAVQDAEQRRRLLDTPATSSSPDLTPPFVAALAASELDTVTKAVAKFATDKDRGIQQLRQSLERERVALAALSDTIQARQKTVAAASEATAALEQTRVQTVDALGKQALQLSDTITQLQMEDAAWANYYEKLAQAIQVANAPAPPPTNTSTTSTNTGAPRNDTPARIPLVRYVGTWTYPIVNGLAHGAQPESIELEVREKDGHAEGTLLGRFKPSPGGPKDPTVRFTFEGEFGASTNQKFTLMTSDGIPGVLELIPGPAFNLLEVNFQTDPQPNKIRSGNFILVKK